MSSKRQWTFAKVSINVLSGDSATDGHLPDVFAPTDPEMFQAVGARLRPELLAGNTPILTDEQIDREAREDEDAKIVLRRVNARKPVNQMYQGPDNLRVGDVGGYVAHLQYGALGLVKVASA